MSVSLIDTHAHLDDSRFDSDLPAVLQRATDAGVRRILTIGIDRSTSLAAVRLAEQYPTQLAAVVGIQPNHVAETQPGDWEEIVRLASDSSVVGIGETGLDRYWDRAPFPLQEEYFVRHLELAVRINKPVIIHCREAESDVLRVLTMHFERIGLIRGIMHSFSGDLNTAQQCLKLGLHISFAGMITYKNANDLRLVAREIPMERILVETDSPYLAPMPFRGKRNEPAYVLHTASCLAELKGIDLSEFARQTTQNANELFGWK